MNNNLEILFSKGNEKLAQVFVAKLDKNTLVEMAESVQPPIPRKNKWVLIVSTLKGCPVNCSICDAGSFYSGKLTESQILQQIDFLIQRRYPNKSIPANKFKIQFARMGDPAFNPAVIDAIRKIPLIYDAPGFIPSISTIAPKSCDSFFDKLIDLKNDLFKNGKFQFQFSLHTTDFNMRQKLIPVKTWSFEKMALYGDKFWTKGDQKIALNFAAPKGFPLDAKQLLQYFDPDRYLIKLTPINPTNSAGTNRLLGIIDSKDSFSSNQTVKQFEDAGYQTILSIGEFDEDNIKSNCGHAILPFLHLIKESKHEVASRL